MTVRIQTDDFDAGFELNQLRSQRPDTGAVVSFIGQVRDLNDDKDVTHLTLEHYPEMTEKALQAIIQKAQASWDIFDALIIHRVGLLKPTEQIVMVAVTSAHRGEAFHACEFIMDYLKTEAPFWKKEQGKTGSRWVEAKESDNAAKLRW